MVATGKGKDRYRATTRKLLLMPRQVHTPGWVVSPGWQGPAVERRQAAAADGAWPVSTAVPGVQRAPGPVWVSRVRNVETVPWVRISGAGMRRRCGKPTVRGAEFPGRTGCSKSECRQLKGSRKSGAAGSGTPPGWSLYNWPDSAPRGAVCPNGGVRPSIACRRSGGMKLEAARAAGRRGRVGAASTKSRRSSTAGWGGRGERNGKVYVRNRCRYAS